MRKTSEVDAMRSRIQSAARKAALCASAETSSCRWSGTARLPDGAPGTPVACQQGGGILRTRAAGRVIGEVAGRPLGPCLDQRLNRSPSGLHLIGTLKQRLVALETTVQQRLVAHGRRLLEPVGIFEIHRHTFEVHFWPRALGVEPQ